MSAVVASKPTPQIGQKARYLIAVTFTDESRFTLYRSDERHRVYRRSGVCVQECDSQSLVWDGFFMICGN